MNELVGTNVVEKYLNTYPQLSFIPENGLRNEEKYKDIVLRGYVPDTLVYPYQITGLESEIEVSSPIGLCNVLYLPSREVFEHFVKILAYKGENVDIPKTTGAIMISGLNNWRKIEAHKKEFLETHVEEEWDREFDVFTSNSDNYRDSVLLISRGYYSALDYNYTCYSSEEWIDISKNIRIYHEITHLICRKLFPEHIEAVRDEVIADSIGIYGALGKYDAELERRVLGIFDGQYKKGSRLENYVAENELNESVDYCKELIEKLERFYEENEGKPFELLDKIERSYIGKRC